MRIKIALQNVVSIQAKRPRYQEGYLVGKFPFSNRKSESDDLANRMVAKFAIDNTNNDFWDEHFLPMPEEVLFPINDDLELELRNLKNDFEENFKK